jgi:hypothetical protein
MEPIEELKKREAREAGIKMYQKYIDDMAKEDKAMGQKGKMGSKSVNTETNSRKVDASLFKTNVHKPQQSGG